MLKLLVLVLAILAFGCSERRLATPRDLGEPIDSHIGDGGAPADGGPGDIDASSTPDAGRRDAAVGDASTLDGGSALSAMAVCARLCEAIGVCAGSSDPGCATECVPDLADCTALQLETLAACETEGCDPGPTGDPALIVCVTMVACVDTGSPPPPPPPPPMPSP